MSEFKLIEGQDFYWENGDMVLTEAYLLKIRTRCCGNGCRHCPFEPSYTKGTITLKEGLEGPKNIGVISLNSDDFITWKKDNNLFSINGIDTKIKFTMGMKTYYCISKVEDLCSKRFDEVMETNDAKSNPSYNGIKSFIYL